MDALFEDEQASYSPSVCPLCRKTFDVSLILPCSHTLCRSCLAEQCESGVKGVVSFTDGSALGAVSMKRGGVNCVYALSQAKVKSLSSTGTKAKEMAYTSSAVSYSSGGGVKGVASSSKGDIIKGMMSLQLGFKSVASNSQLGAFLCYDGVLKMSPSNPGGVKAHRERKVTSGFQNTNAVGRISTEYKGGVKEVSHLSQGGIREVASIQGGDIKLSLMTQSLLASSRGEVKEKDSSSTTGAMETFSESHEDIRGMYSDNLGRDKTQNKLKEVDTVMSHSSLHEGFRGVASSIEGGVRSVTSKAVISASHPICTIFCPNCDYRVELPCFNWSSALTCLPHDPTVTRDPKVGGGLEKRSWEMDGSLDLSEEEMKRSVTGLSFTLDSSSCDWPLCLSGSALSVSFKVHGSKHYDPEDLPQVCAGVHICRGQFYWEVDVCNSALYRIGVVSSHEGHGWWLERNGSTFHAVFDRCREPLPSIPPNVKTVGVFLNVGGASITFHNTVTQECMATFPSNFRIPLRPAVQLGEGRLKLRSGLPPPNHVFLCRSSAYHGPQGAGPGRWRRDVRFSSVKDTIQKFEGLQNC